MLVGTWNVNGIRAREAQFLDWVARERPDVICLQETKADPTQLSLSLAVMPDYWGKWHSGAKGYSGVSLHLRKGTFPAKPEFTHPPFDLEGRVVGAVVGDLLIESIYLPNGNKDYDGKIAFMEGMATHIVGVHEAGGQLLICGDLNVARAEMDVHPKLRDGRVIGQRAEERALFERMIGGLVDVGRALEPANDALFTWWPYWRDSRKRNIGWRLDYVLLSERAARRAQSCRVLHEFGTSDHAPVLATIEGVG